MLFLHVHGETEENEKTGRIVGNLGEIEPGTFRV
jgi:hypothetical protein